MRIGIHSFIDGANLEGAIQQVVKAEEEGFDSFWFGQALGADVMTAIALAGQRTERIEIGVAVVPTYSRHPFAMAQQALTVQAATGGRFTLGIGPSHRPLIEGMWGLSYDRAALHVREYLSVLRDLVQDGRASLSGELYRVSGALQLAGTEPCAQGPGRSGRNRFPGGDVPGRGRRPAVDRPDPRLSPGPDRQGLALGQLARASH